MVSFAGNPGDTLKIMDIAAKAEGLVRSRSGLPRIDRLQLAMSLTACHYNGCPLDLDGLLSADDFNLLHDAIGIHGNINRDTGELENFFRPRFASRSEAVTEAA